MGSQRIRSGLLGIALVGGVALLLLIARPRFGPLRQAVAALREQSSAPATAWRQAVAPATGTGDRSVLADNLNSRARDVHSDLRIVNAIFVAYRGALHEENPVGENVEITRALTGRNRLGFAFIPLDCPARNAKGELCDRWGSPYFFHQLSGQRMEIRSAGPDKRLWTADDEILTP
jgi:hypothetical protein